MSTSETVTLNVGLCPCGNGNLSKHVTTQDNPWSGADIHYSIDCDRCREDWRLEGETSTAVLQSSEAGHIAAKREERFAYEAFNAAARQLIADYFSSFSAKNKKLEHAEMERLNLTSIGYRQYLEHRRRGLSIASACHGQRNTEWLLRQAATCGRGEEVAELLESYQTSKNAASEAARRIVRQRLT